MTEPQTAELYAQRAGAQPRPAGYVDETPKLFTRFREKLTTAAPSRQFFADISEFQTVVNSKYPYSILSFRADNGYRTDNHAHANWSYCHGSSKIKLAIAYVVYIPGELNAVMSRIHKLFGSTCPAKLVVMVDMESGKGFAGPGNHSADANKWLAAFEAYTKTKSREYGYANHYDFIDCWPQVPSWLKKHTAAYSTHNPGTYGWQYYGGMNYPTASGYPRSCAPFGSWVDMNVINKPLATILKDFGITPAPAPKPTPKPTPKPAPKPAPVSSKVYYTVKQNDTLSGIAAKYHNKPTWQEIAKLNNIKGPKYEIYPNQRIRIK